MWYEYFKCCAFIQFAFKLHVSSVRFHHCFHVAQSQPKTFHIMYVTSGHAVELFKHTLSVIPAYSNASVGNTYKYSSILIAC